MIADLASLIASDGCLVAMGFMAAAGIVALAWRITERRHQRRDDWRRELRAASSAAKGGATYPLAGRPRHRAAVDPFTDYPVDGSSAPAPAGGCALRVSHPSAGPHDEATDGVASGRHRKIDPSESGMAPLQDDVPGANRSLRTSPAPAADLMQTRGDHGRVSRQEQLAAANNPSPAAASVSPTLHRSVA